MNTRIEYIDVIKGFAIFLVVMGHVVAWQFSDFYIAYGSHDYDNQLILWRLIYSFHMPLFMFCSGLFLKRFTKESCCSDLMCALQKRCISLLLPYFSMGLLLWLLWGSFDFYWFLLVLFEFQVINLSISYVSSQLRKYSNVAEIAIYIVVYILFALLGKYGKSIEHLPFIDIGHLGLYIYFTLGTLCVKYGILEKIVTRNLLYTLFLTLFLVFTGFRISVQELPLGRICAFIIAVSAIAIVLYFFYNVKINFLIDRVLKDMGRRSLELYTLHLMVPITIPYLGEVYLRQIENMGGGISTIYLAVFCVFIYISISNMSVLYSNNDN